MQAKGDGWGLESRGGSGGERQVDGTGSANGSEGVQPILST